VTCFGLDPFQSTSPVVRAAAAPHFGRPGRPGVEQPAVHRTAKIFQPRHNFACNSGTSVVIIQSTKRYFLLGLGDYFSSKYDIRGLNFTIKGVHVVSVYHARK
jgi:hypothetical protein